VAHCPTCSSPVADGSRFCAACGLALFQSQTPTLTSSQPGAGPDDSPRPPSDSHLGGRFIPGKVLGGRYRVIERVGQGGMGEVYRAEDLKLAQIVALKFLPQALDRDPRKLGGLLAEVRIARQVSHPAVCRVYDIGETDGLNFISMEFVDGEDLASLLRRIGRLPADKAIEIAREICAGLAAIHDRGVLHRDLKPANVMVDGRGRARITDFGLAALKGMADDGDMIVGTPAYMAPECLAGQEATLRSDLFSLGLVLYELFTGKRAFEARSVEEMMHVRRERPPTSPSTHVPDLNPVVERLILRCIEKEPDRRPPSVLAVAAGLPGGDLLAAAIAAGETPSPELVAAGVGEPRSLPPALGRACLVALVVGLGAVVTLSPRTRIVPAARPQESPAVLAVRARDLLRGLGFDARPADRAQGFLWDEAYVDHIAATDRSRARWARLSASRPPAVVYWYRESPRELPPAAPRHEIGYADPPPILPGMVGVQLDLSGRLRRLDAVPIEGDSMPTASPRAWSFLFAAAGLDTSGFRRAIPRARPVTAADDQQAWLGEYPEAPEHTVRVEAASWRGHPVLFAVIEPWSPGEGSQSRQTDPSVRLTTVVSAFMRPALFPAVLLTGAWLARRNLRAGRADRKRAFRVATALMAMRILVWILGGHHTPGRLAEQLATALAWSLFDFAYAWIFYMAIEPYVRRLWPRALTSWMRLLDGRLDDPRVGRDLLVGGLTGVFLSLGIAFHQMGSVVFGAPPGRPDNVGFVEHQLAGLLGLHQQVAHLLTLFRSAILLALAFVVVLVLARLIVRRATPALVATCLLFLPLAMPRGELPGLNVALAAWSMVAVLIVMMRVGMLAATLGLMVNSALQSTALDWNLGSWSGQGTVLVLLMVLGLGIYGLARALGGRPASRDLLAKA